MVVPTGFLTAQSGIEKRIRQKLVDEKMLRGVVAMPSNIFATTGTNVSISIFRQDQRHRRHCADGRLQTRHDRQRGQEPENLACRPKKKR